MTEAERLKLGERRKLLFRNFCNGVPVEQLTGAFLLSEAEVINDILFVARKLREYTFRRVSDAKIGVVGVPVQSDNLADIRKNRAPLMAALSKVGPKYLSSELLLPEVKIQKLDHPSMIKEANHRARHSR